MPNPIPRLWCWLVGHDELESFSIEDGVEGHDVWCFRCGRMRFEPMEKRDGLSDAARSADAQGPEND